MSALTAVVALEALLSETPSWLPEVRSWELAQDGDDWVLSGELAADISVDTITRALERGADDLLLAVADDGRRITAAFTWQATRVQLWHLRPVLRWIVPERCATCPTELGAPDVPFVTLGEGLDAPVVCIPCRDRMHTDWVVHTCPATVGRTEHHWWFSLPDGGWRCTPCRTVRTDINDPATTVRPAVIA